METEDEDNPLPSLQVPASAPVDRASESVVSTGVHAPVPFAPISSSPILVGGIAEPAESSRSIASAVPISTRGQTSLPIPRKEQLPLRTVVLVAGGVVVALVLCSLLLFR